MREQAPSKLTPEQGWAKMKPILDREMPVEKRSRRFPFFWWTTAVGVLLGISGLLAWYTMGEPPTPVNEQIRIPNAPHQAAPPQEANPGFADHKASEAMNKAGNERENVRKPDVPEVNASTGSIASAPSSTSRTEKRVPKRKTTEGSTSGNPGQHPSGNLVVASQAESAIAIQPPSYTSDRSEEPSNVASSIPFPASHSDRNVASQNEAKVITAGNGQVISQLPWMGFAFIDEFGERDENSISFLPRLTAHSSRLTVDGSRLTDDGSRFAIHPFATANALAGFHGGGGGYVGAGIDVDIVPRLDLNLGGGYRSYDPQLSFLPKSSRLDADFNADLGAILQNDNNYPGIPEYIASESFTSSSSYLALNSIVETLHQWQLNLGMTYSFAKRFYAEGGLAWDFGTKAKSQYPIISLDGALPTSNVRVSHSLDEYHLVRKSMTSWYGGLGCHIGRHFDVYGQVIFSFQPYLLTTDYSTLVTGGGEREDYINGMTLGVRYKL